MRTMTDVDPALLHDAVELLQRAGAMTLEWFLAPDLAIERKGDGTPVTAADKAAERFLREEIRRRYPDDSIVGEEEANHQGTSERTWIIDPIDGTKAFTHGVPLYCNLLAIDDGEGNAVGVINLPALDEVVYAGRGLGCFHNGNPTRVSSRDRVAGSYVSSCGFDYWPDDLLLRVKHTDAVLRTWGDGYGYALVATGRIDAMIDPEVAVWDVAPMPVILREAGGRFTSWNGNEDASEGTGIATNGLLHDELLGLLQG
jgi:histidinol phosphatase-like enzyme (inositol monophosphatase family)